MQNFKNIYGKLIMSIPPIIGTKGLMCLFPNIVKNLKVHVYAYAELLYLSKNKFECKNPIAHCLTHIKGSIWMHFVHRP